LGAFGLYEYTIVGTNSSILEFVKSLTNKA